MIRCHLFLSPSNLSNDSRRNGEAAAVKYIEVAHGQLARLLNDASATARYIFSLVEHITLDSVHSTVHIIQ